MQYTRPTKALIGFMVLSAIAMVSHAAWHGSEWHPYLGLLLLVVALATSRMKVKIPGVDGNMSVNLPFLMLSVVTLNVAEAILVAGASTAMQTLPQGGKELNRVQMLFNVSMMTLTSGGASLLFHRSILTRASWGSVQILLVGTAITFFLGQTLPVSLILALTEGGAVRRIWASIAQMTFPYYVVGAGVTSMVQSVSHHLGWVTSLAALPVMYGIHRSYCLYFAAAAQPGSAPLAKAASVGGR